jgi:ribosomal protein L37AE/L43A
LRRKLDFPRFCDILFLEGIFWISMGEVGKFWMDFLVKFSRKKATFLRQIKQFFQSNKTHKLITQHEKIKKKIWLCGNIKIEIIKIFKIF